MSATALEVAPLAARLPTISPHHIDLLTTGIGMVATAAQCGRTLAVTAYDLALNFGVCGSFDPALPPCTVVHVVRDRLAELGAEDGDRFLPLEQLRLSHDGAGPVPWLDLENPAPPRSAALAALPAVSAITVNTVHGAVSSIAAVTRRQQPQVESMEGAAFAYACLAAGVPFAQVRAVSNRVERRDRAAWRLDDAVAALNATARSILETL